MDAPANLVRKEGIAKLTRVGVAMAFALVLSACSERLAPVFAGMAGGPQAALQTHAYQQSLAQRQAAEPSPASKAAYERNMLAYTECIKAHATPQILSSNKTFGHAKMYVEDAAASKNCRPELINAVYSFDKICTQCMSKLGYDEFERRMRMLGETMVILEYKNYGWW